MEMLNTMASYLHLGTQKISDKLPLELADLTDYEKGIHKIRLADKTYYIDDKSVAYLPHIKEKLDAINSLRKVVFIPEINSNEFDTVIKAVNHIVREGSLYTFEMQCIPMITMELISAVKFLEFKELYEKIVELIKYMISRCTQFGYKLTGNNNIFELNGLKIYMDDIIQRENDWKIFVMIFLIEKNDIIQDKIEINCHFTDVLPVTSNYVKKIERIKKIEKYILQENFHIFENIIKPKLVSINSSGCRYEEVTHRPQLVTNFLSLTMLKPFLLDIEIETVEKIKLQFVTDKKYYLLKNHYNKNFTEEL